MLYNLVILDQIENVPATDILRINSEYVPSHIRRISDMLSSAGDSGLRCGEFRSLSVDYPIYETCDWSSDNILRPFFTKIEGYFDHPDEDVEGFPYGVCDDHSQILENHPEYEPFFFDVLKHSGWVQPEEELD